MTDTEIILAALHEGTVIPFVDICEKYFGLGKQEARLQATLNLLPLPT